MLPVVVRPVTVAIVQIVLPLFTTVMFPVSKFNVRVLELLLLNRPAVSVNVPSDKVPLLSAISRRDDNVNALPSVHPPPTPLKVTLPFMVTPFVVTVLPVVVELNVIVPVESHTVPARRVIDPETLNVGVVPVAKVTVPADTVKLRHVRAPVIVTVYVPA